MPSRSLLVALCAALVLAACGGGPDGSDPEAVFLQEVRIALDELLDGQVPEYTDEELLAFGERTCDNLEEVRDGDNLRRAIEGASVGAGESETLQIAQATVLVTAAARHLCPDQGERLGLLDGAGST